MIQLLRVDHRLLHGQVVFSWCGQLNPNCILIANDAAATDDVRKAALRLGKPNNAKLVIKTYRGDIVHAIVAAQTFDDCLGFTKVELFVFQRAHGCRCG